MKKAKRGSKVWRNNILLSKKIKKGDSLIKKARYSKLLSQEEMAKKIGISFNCYSRIERGLLPLKIERATMIAKILKINKEQAFKKDSRLKNKFIAK